MRVNVLTPGFTTSNGSAFLFPLVVHRNALRDASIDLRLARRSSRGLTDCDVLAIDSKEFRSEWGEHESRTLELISSYGEARVKIVWFDTTDSTGTLQASTFPVIDKYLKSQVLADKSLYTTRLHGGRIYSEYYNKLAGITDDDVEAINDPITGDDTAKLGISWNAGLADYSTFGPWRIGLYRRSRFARFLSFPGAIEPANSSRTNELSARFGATYNKATVRYQREQIREKLSTRLDTNKLNRRGYIHELRNSKVIVSPFGWGEITLKDFEVFLTGGMLLKPSMNHLKTWPNFYEKEVTYLSHNWDLTDLEAQIEWAVTNETDRLEIAQEGQRRYTEHTSGRTAAEKFISHFKDVIST